MSHLQVTSSNLLAKMAESFVINVTSEDTTMSSSTTTAKNTATTAVIDAVSKQNFTPGENSGKIDLSGEIVSAFTQSAIIALVPQEYQDLTASITNLGISLANAYILSSLF